MRVLLLIAVLSPVYVAKAGPPRLQPADGAGAVWLIHEGHAGATRASGVVEAVDSAERHITVSHGPIKSLGWPAMTMDFTVNKSIDLSSVKAGMKVNFSLVRGENGAWLVDTLEPK